MNTPYLYKLLTLLIFSLSLGGCRNELPMAGDGQSRIEFPRSLTLEKIIGTTWRLDADRQQVILPTSLEALSPSARPILAISGGYLHSLQLSKTGQAYVSYLVPDLANTIFYYTGSWQLDPEHPEELLLRFGSPLGSEFVCRMKIRSFHLLDNMLHMEAFFVNPEYSFSAELVGKGAQENYWSRETDVIDPSWTQRNPISTEPLAAQAFEGNWRVNSEDWKRVSYMDDVLNNLYPLLQSYRLNFSPNGEVVLLGLPVPRFGVNHFRGRWQVEGSRVKLHFDLFPFFGDNKAYPGVFESDVIFPIVTTYARQQVTLYLELVRREQDKMLVRLTEPGVCSVVLMMHAL